MKVIKNIVGDVKVTEFTAAHAAFFEKESRKSVAGPTVNRGLAVLSHMFTFALKTKGIIQSHPMARYGLIPEDEKALRGYWLLRRCVGRNSSSYDRRVATEMEVRESRRAKSVCRGFQELQDAPRPSIRLRNRIAPVITSSDRMRMFLRGR